MYYKTTAGISKFRNCGQVCVATNRVLVQKSVYDLFIQKLVNRVKILTYGDGLTSVDIGGIINEAGYNKVVSHVEYALEKGATCLVGGKGMRSLDGKGGFLFQPAVLTGIIKEMKIETFGPVLPIMIFETEAEAIEMANDIPHGLAAYVYTTNLERSVRVSEALE